MCQEFLLIPKVLIETHLVWATHYQDGKFCTLRLLTRKEPYRLPNTPVVTYGCESWTIKKAERRRIDAFELCCWRRLSRVAWTARRSNQSILKEISPGLSKLRELVMDSKAWRATAHGVKKSQTWLNENSNMCPGEPPKSSQPRPQPTPASAWVIPRSAWPLAVNCPGWVSSHGTVGTRMGCCRPERVPPTPGGTACPHSCDHLGAFSSSFNHMRAV